LLGAAASAFAASTVSAGLLTFTERASLPAHTVVPIDYQPVGLPAGVTTLFANDNGVTPVPAFETDTDPDHTWGNVPGKAAELYGIVDPARIFFSTPVIVPSLFATQAAGPAFFTVRGYLGNVLQWSQTGFMTYDVSNPQNTFTHVTNGAGILIDSLAFVNYRDNLLDDITVDAAPVPEPSSCVLFVLGAVGVFVAARRRQQLIHHR
jgi:hypothetical protein